MKPLSLGFSPCPNDTFIFHGMVHGMVETPLVFHQPLLEDVETLNTWAMESRLDVTKLSVHALGHVLDDYCVLSAGSALGRGCGPLLVAARPLDIAGAESWKVAIPGKYTTASMLFQMFAPQCSDIVEMRFERIMSAVAKGDVDAGVIIHESRFTYEQDGLVCLQDLGQWWEQTSSQPIPLGCIAARRDLGRETINEIDRVVKASLELAYGDPHDCLPYIRKHSQEIDEKVVQDHIEWYVNEYSLELGEEGRQAVATFLQRGREAGILLQSNARIML
jgi:1,4-dihydroxy-6-naphthoate synthase